MRLARPTRLRAATLIALAVASVVAPATAALAHNGTGGASSDYRVQITGYDGDASGIALRVVELGNRLELRRTTAASVMILGYSGEPYLRLDGRGVYENVNSPAHYLDLDRFASTNPPATASATATPSWTKVASGSTIRWHDHRAHWMSTTPRADVQADPDVERVIFDAQRIDFEVDGHAVSAIIRVTWLPTPDRYVWLAVAAVAAMLCAAALVLIDGAQRWLTVVAFIGTIASLLGQGSSPARHLLGAAAMIIAVSAVPLRRPVVSVVAAATAGALAATRLEVFEHELLAGWPAAVGQRVAIVIAVALCGGVVASAVVGALGPTSAEASTRSGGSTGAA